MAAPTPAPRPTPGSNGMIPAEWPAQAADAIVDAVGKVRDKTTTPALKAARAVVYGVIVLVVAVIAVILVLVGSIKALEHLPGHIWTIYAAYAVIFSSVGLFALRKAKRPAAAAAA